MKGLAHLTLGKRRKLSNFPPWKAYNYGKLTKTIDSLRRGRTRHSIIGEATFRSQSANEWAISTSSLCSNWVFKSQPAGMGGARRRI